VKRNVARDADFVLKDCKLYQKYAAKTVTKNKPTIPQGLDQPQNSS
jgi:hypothetical protein